MNSLAFAVLTGSTCGPMCWEAHEDTCRCSCGGANHGILNHGGERPDRTCKIDGNFYELAAIIPGPGKGEAWITCFNACRDEVNSIFSARFPGIDTWAYGSWRPEKTLPVVDRKISASQMKWPEVMAVPNAARLIWSRPAGTPYYVRGNDKPIIHNLEVQL